MAEQRERSEWARTSALLALIANAHRDPRKSRPFRPSDFDPFVKRSEGDMAALRAVFTGKEQAPGAGRSGEDKEAGS